MVSHETVMTLAERVFKQVYGYTKNSKLDAKRFSFIRDFVSNQTLLDIIADPLSDGTSSWLIDAWKIFIEKPENSWIKNQVEPRSN